jgi:hypothetical protein
LPYAFFNLLNPIVSVALAMLGWGLLKTRAVDAAPQG